MSKKIISLLLVLVMLVACFAACSNKNNKNNNNNNNNNNNENNNNNNNNNDDVVQTPIYEFVAPVRPADAPLPAPKIGSYTYKGAAVSLGNNWNPHSWETNADDSILSYLSSPFVTMEAKDTEEGLYQWVGEMATSIKDITATNQDKLTRYNVTLPKGKTAADITSGYVYEIKLNPNAKWQDGSVIDASDYVYSMKQLLNPDMKNYRANLYISGESALAGAFNYYYSKDAGFYNGYTTKYDSLADAMAAETVYIDVWEFWGAKGYTDAEGNTCPQWLPINDETIYGEAQGDAFSAALLLQHYGSYLEVGGGYEGCAGIYVENTNVGASYDDVGLYVVDDYTIVYVCDTAIEFNYFLTSCTSTWLVHEGLYEANKETLEGGAVITKYGTSKETTMSYGTWKLQTFEDSKQVVFVRNENWYGWEDDGNGNLVSYTQFTVDGKYLQQYITTSVVIDVMTTEVAKQKFMKGEIDSWSPNADELSEYKLSDRLQIVDETYTMSFFFNTDIEKLKALDASGKNTNSVVLTNDNFRKAMSLAIDRSDFVTATQAWTPAFSLMNHLYHYDIYNDPSSSYRKSKEAMQAICNLYGVEYGPGKLYETLEEAHDSITGYNLTQAKALMKQACDELVAANLYTKGAEIKIQIGWAKGASTPDDITQCNKIQQYLNAAIEGSGFGAITLDPKFDIVDRYGDTASGLYAIGYGAWGGAAFYPFRNLQVYTDPDQYDINEAGCWDPTTETLTLTWTDDEGNSVTDTLTWQDWGNALVGTGKYAGASNKVKLAITAMLEEKFLAKFYRIPLAVTTACSLNSYKVEDYTDIYNIMYGFGGFRIMDYNYNDAEWNAYVESQNGELDYH